MKTGPGLRWRRLAVVTRQSRLVVPMVAHGRIVMIYVVLVPHMTCGV